MRRTLDVGIIGAGTAGSAAAIFLARAGHDVTVYERVLEPGPVGAGITLQPIGMHVLARLGLYDSVVARGARIDRLACTSSAGRLVFELSYDSISPNLFGLGVHRGVLFEALWSAVARESVTVRTGIEIVDLDRAAPLHHGGRARHGWLIDRNRQRHGPHELIVVADGARSQLRDDTKTTKRVTQYPWGALWFVGNDTRDPGDPGGRVLTQVADGNRRLVGLLPTGQNPHDTLGTSRMVSLFYSLRCDQYEPWRARGLDAWKREVRDLAKAAAPVLDQIEAPEQVLFATYYDVVMNRWSTRNVVTLGDAAHATSPQLGQGANLALWDAMVLADELAREDRDLAVALDRYSRARAEHLAFYQLATRALTPFFQGDASWMGTLRDVAMPLMAKIPLARRLMTLSMLGVVDGFGGKLLKLDLDEATRREAIRRG